jgi:hypothetical protein
VIRRRASLTVIVYLALLDIYCDLPTDNTSNPWPPASPGAETNDSQAFSERGARVNVEEKAEEL